MNRNLFNALCEDLAVGELLGPVADGKARVDIMRECPFVIEGVQLREASRVSEDGKLTDYERIAGMAPLKAQREVQILRGRHSPQCRWRPQRSFIDAVLALT